MAHQRSHRGQAECEGNRSVRMRISMETDQVANHLESLAKAFRAGGITICNEKKLVALTVGTHVTLKLDAGYDAHQNSVRLELTWDTPASEARLVISPGIVQPSSFGSDVHSDDDPLNSENQPTQNPDSSADAPKSD